MEIRLTTRLESMAIISPWAMIYHTNFQYSRSLVGISFLNNCRRPTNCIPEGLVSAAPRNDISISPAPRHRFSAICESPSNSDSTVDLALSGLLGLKAFPTAPRVDENAVSQPISGIFDRALTKQGAFEKDVQPQHQDWTASLGKFVSKIERNEI